MFLTEFNRSLRLVKITIAGDTTADEARSGLWKMRCAIYWTKKG
jgi:hypothetical protein